ncbi:MAG: type II toxin-antitoxin system VapC family toxin [Acidobacteria bacterium]|nr:type II toxin-antitoxin system VapC family toxin [Acidobacteriota bacterium]
MARPERLWVLDTSVAAAWFFEDDPAHGASLAVRDDLRDRPAAYVVPPLFYAELVHVLARKSGKRPAFVRAALRLILRLGIRTVGLPESALVRTADWACKALGGYDATFVALAEDLGARWITADERAARAAGRDRAVALARWSPRA